MAANKANLFEYYRYLGRSPQAEFYDGPGLTWLLTGIHHPFLNNVLRTRLTPANVDDTIARTLAYFTSRNVTQLSWWIEPGAGRRICRDVLAHGLVYTDGGRSMAVELSALDEDLSNPVELVIERVGDNDTLKRWVAAFAAGFGLAGSRRASFDLYAGLGFDLPLRSYVGCLKGEPVATAQLFLGAGVAGVYCVSTVPQARCCGIGAALTLAALHEPRDEGYRAAILQSSPMGFRVYRRLGFPGTLAG